MDYLNLSYPHGFLIWRGKQTAIASDELLDNDKFLIVTDDDAFGEASLGKPSAMTTAVFDRNIESHCCKVYERKLMWPDAKSLYVYPIKSFKGFEEPVLFQDGELAEYEPDLEEQEMIRQAGNLPARIVIDSDAVCAGGKGFDICEIVKDNNDLHQILEAVYETEILENGSDKSLPIYQLALVRNPKFIVKKKKESSEEAKQDMPWEIREEFADCSGFAVVKVDDDSVVGCHETIDEAEAQLVALNLSEQENQTEEEVELEDKQDEELEIREGFAIIDVESGDLVSCHPTQELAEEQLEELLLPEEEQAHEEEKAGKRLNAAMLKRLKEAWQTIKDLMAWGEYQDKQLSDKDYGIAIKEVNGEPWIITWSSNAFEDRDKEIVSTKALEEWSEQVNKRKDKGFFNFWHMRTNDQPELTDFAKKEWTGVPGRILIEAGPFLKDEKGQKALEFFKQHLDGHSEIAPEGWGCSIEFKFLPEERVTGVFENVEITRTSILPRFAAANIHTQVKEIAMSMTDEQKQAALEVFGETLGTSLIGGAENKSKELEENIAHKEEETKPEGYTLEQVVEAVIKELNVGLDPISEALAKMAEVQKSQGLEIEQMKKVEAVKEETEMPRFYFQAVQASKADSTVIADDDDLAQQKPEETNKKDLSVAGRFFTGG